MSVRLIAAAIESTLPPPLKLVAIVYANSANDEDCIVWLSIEGVALRSGYKERQTRTLTKALAAAGVLAVVPEDQIPPSAWNRGLGGIPRNKRPKVYRFGVQSLPNAPGVQSATIRGAIHDTSGVQPIAPKPEEEPEETPLASKPTRKPDHLAETLASMCFIQFTNMTTSAHGAFNRALK